MTVVCIKLKIGRKEAATWVTMTQKVKLLPVPGWGNFGMLMSNRQLVHNRDADAKRWLMYYGLQAESSLWLFQVTTCRGRGHMLRPHYSLHYCTASYFVSALHKVDDWWWQWQQRQSNLSAIIGGFLQMSKCMSFDFKILNEKKALKRDANTACWLY